MSCGQVSPLALFQLLGVALSLWIRAV